MPTQPARVSVDDTASRAHRAAGVAESLLESRSVFAPPSGHATAAMSVFTRRRGSRATFPIIRPSRSVVAARQERSAAPSLFQAVVARCMARDLRAAKLSRSTRAFSSPAPSAAGAWPRSATGFDVMLGLAQGEAKYGDLENRLAYSRAITVPTITNGGRRQWLAAPGTHPHAKMFLGKFEHRTHH
jgi:hypothetical protein